MNDERNNDDDARMIVNDDAQMTYYNVRARVIDAIEKTDIIDDAQRARLRDYIILMTFEEYD